MHSRVPLPLVKCRDRLDKWLETPLSDAVALSLLQALRADISSDVALTSARKRELAEMLQCLRMARWQDDRLHRVRKFLQQDISRKCPYVTEL